MLASSPAAALLAGRYELLHEIAAGGMATVHLARLAGPGGFSHTFAVKRLHPQFAKSPEFVAMFLDEARLAARVRHANVVRVFEVFLEGGELFLVLEYVEGPSLDRLITACARRGQTLPRDIAIGIVHGALMGLHAAHEAKDDAGKPLQIVHRDVSPHNVLVGLDGIARLLDFGIAKAESRLGSTREGQIKGKFAYMAPEQVQGEEVDRRTDVFAMGIVLWEVLTGQRLYEAPSEGASVLRILRHDAPPPSTHAPAIEEALDAVALRALAKDPAARFTSARAFARALEEVSRVATPSEVATFLEGFTAEDLGRKRAAARVEEGTADHVVPSAITASHVAPRLALADPALPNDVLPTQVTHVTRVDVAEPPPSRLARVMPWMLAAALVGGIGGFVAWSRANAEGASLAAPPLVISPATPIPTSTAAATPTSTAIANPTTTASATPAATSSNVARPASTWRAPPAPPKANCDPPFDVLPSGVKRYKRACVR